ncbi:hypothetical protein TVAG_271930 [Trichomonas vaginalis G3]|uniref:VPS9 domain-containing protein n=1 Tax=Trichomonas vaginalis (strain ATCC PRA-98 / G3) TaxID=412133 RepID=A2E5U0_TRIV3|nr:VPS9 domain family [Trichomonas vaginalis G3]EAY12010.1 hypothetical protein TVAG_271930 [Trichomonas vaginalis G3]KAI5524816.1 VPS9 domain family [Trichomonas vaginalis G3]|eukprot:XP_001324233.1 hypothetical protein [Trichomonas vaginalis G3]
MYSSSSVQDMPDFQRETKEIMASIRLQEDEIKSNRKELFESIKKTQEMKCIYSLSSGYFLHINDNIQQIANLPFVQPGKFVVYKRLIELTNLGSLRSEITRFLSGIYKNSDKLPLIFAKLQTTSIKNPVPFLPKHTEPNHFLAFSTLPALFGHCWTSDLRYSYINFLIKICEKIPYDSIQHHWILDCFKHYIHSSDIQTFLRESIGDYLLDLIRDTTLDLIQQAGQKELYDRIIPVIEKIISKMNANIDLIPMDVRLLIRKFADLALDDAQWLKRVEDLFCKSILAPAISFPKVYGVILPTINLKVASNGVARALQIIASLLLVILHPGQAEFRYPGLDVERLSRLPFESFLRSMMNFKCESLSGLTCTSLLPLLGMHNTSFIFNVQDVAMLAHVLKIVSKEDQEIAKQVLPLISKIPVDQPLDMTFFRYDLWDVQNIGVERPDIKVNTLESAKNKELQAISKSIFNFLPQSQEIPFSPHELFPFLKFHAEHAALGLNTHEICYINNVMHKMKEVPHEKSDEIIVALEDEMRRHKAYSNRNSTLLTQIAISLAEVNSLKASYIAKIDDQLPFLHEKLFELFHDNENSEERFKSKFVSIVICHSSFVDFFTEELAKLKTFLDPIASFAFSGVAKLMHTYMLQKIGVKKFSSYHTLYQATDELFERLSDKDLLDLCITEHTDENVSYFIKNQESFVYATNIFFDANFIEIPIEAIKYIRNAFGIIRKTYALYNGNQPTDSEIEPIIYYLLLKSHVSNIFTFVKYLEHFLDGYPCNTVITSEEYGALKSLVNYITYLDSKVSTKLI